MTIAIDQFINKPELADFATRCIECEDCLEACCTFLAEKNKALSPMGRLNIIARFFDKQSLTAEDVEALYLCTDCGRCDTVCATEIPISEVIADAKVALAESGDGPLEKHDKMIQSIFDNGNAVSGKPERRLDWIPEPYRNHVKFEDSPGNTLLYVGCLSSYVDKKTASASFEILMKGGVDFKLLNEEFCCGIYPYNAGKLNDAEKIFRRMADTFTASGITKIIVPCAGCYRAFSTYYARILESFDIEIFHIAEIIGDLISTKKIIPKQTNGLITYHDACKTGRKSGLFEEPRKILSRCGYEIDELEHNRDDGLCCGSGAGVRSINRELSMKIASGVLAEAGASEVVSTCPFCIFNFNYTAHKKSLAKKALHISVLVRDCLE